MLKEENKVCEKLNVMESVVYSFPSKSRCPRCGQIHTVAYAIHGKIQYRKCLNTICKFTYKETGIQV